MPIIILIIATFSFATYLLLTPVVNTNNTIEQSKLIIPANTKKPDITAINSNSEKNIMPNLSKTKNKLDVANETAQVTSPIKNEFSFDITVHDNGTQSSQITDLLIAGDIESLKVSLPSLTKEDIHYYYTMVNLEDKKDSFNLLHILLMNPPEKNSNEIMTLLIENYGFTLFDRSSNGISIADIFEDMGQIDAANKIRDMEILAQPVQPAVNTKPIDPVLEAFQKDKEEVLHKKQSEADVYIKSIAGRIKDMSNDDLMNEYYRTLTNSKPLVLQYLIDNDFDVNSKDHKGNTPLILAIAKENKEIVLKLVHNGANPNLQANDISPLALAIDRTDPSVLISLILAGADIEEKNIDGVKILDALLENHNHPLSKPLMSFILSNSKN